MTAEAVVTGPSRRLGRGASFTFVVAAYALAIAVAVAVGLVLGDESPVLTAFVADLAATAVIYASSMVLRNGSMYDAYWSVAPPVIALYWIGVAAGGADGTRQAVVLVVVAVWAIRLTSNWARGWPGLHHEDWRYLDLYQKAPRWFISLTGIHLFPTLIVFVGMVPLWRALATGTGEFGPLDIAATVVGLGAAMLELVADEQLRRFNRGKQPGEVMDRGLWRYSRHPNYLGEILFWWSLWLFGVSADPGWWWTVIGPVAMTAMFVLVSIPLLDGRSRARRPEFDAYAARTSMLVPRPPRSATRPASG